MGAAQFKYPPAEPLSFDSNSARAAEGSRQLLGLWTPVATEAAQGGKINNRSTRNRKKMILCSCSSVFALLLKLLVLHSYVILI